jgi:hypothetical protein
MAHVDYFFRNVNSCEMNKVTFREEVEIMTYDEDNPTSAMSLNYASLRQQEKKSTASLNMSQQQQQFNYFNYSMKPTIMVVENGTAINEAPSRLQTSQKINLKEPRRQQQEVQQESLAYEMIGLRNSPWWEIPIMV